jgi:hypothetical protein
MQEVDAKIMVTSLDTRSRMVSSDGTAKILSLHLVKAHCRVQYDSDEDEHAAFHMTKHDSVRHFRPSVSGLYYYDTRENERMLVNKSRRKLCSWKRRQR